MVRMDKAWDVLGRLAPNKALAKKVSLIGPNDSDLEPAKALKAKAEAKWQELQVDRGPQRGVDLTLLIIKGLLMQHRYLCCMKSGQTMANSDSVVRQQQFQHWETRRTRDSFILSIHTDKLAAIRYHHLIPDHGPGVDLQPHRIVAGVLRGIARQTAPPKRRLPIFRDDIVAGYTGAAAGRPAAIATWRCILLAFHLLLRASELWAYNGGHVHPHFCVRACDVQFALGARAVPAIQALSGSADRAFITIRASKTDQYRHGAVLTITATDGGPFDPLHVAAALLVALPPYAPPDCPTVTVAHGATDLRTITHGETTHMIRTLVAQHGGATSQLGTHSMRVGAATTLAHAGVPERLIKLAGQWRSDAYNLKVYIRNSAADFARITDALASAGDVRSRVVPPASAGISVAASVSADGVSAIIVRARTLIHTQRRQRCLSCRGVGALRPPCGGFVARPPAVFHIAGAGRCWCSPPMFRRITPNTMCLCQILLPCLIDHVACHCVPIWQSICLLTHRPGCTVRGQTVINGKSCSAPGGWKPVAGEMEMLQPGVRGNACYGDSTIRECLQRKLATAGVGTLAVDRPLSLNIDSSSSSSPSAFNQGVDQSSHPRPGRCLATVMKVLLQIEDLVDFKFQNPSPPFARKPPYDDVFPDGGTQWDKHMLNRTIKTGVMAAAGVEDSGDSDIWDSGANKMPTHISTAHMLPEGDVNAHQVLIEQLRNDPAFATSCQDIFDQLCGPFNEVFRCQYDAIDVRHHNGLHFADHRSAFEDRQEQRRRNAGKTRQEIAADAAAAEAANLPTCNFNCCMALKCKEVVVDTSVRAPTADHCISPVRISAASTNGFAAAEGEKARHRHHRGTLDESRWIFVPFVQESFGRLEREAHSFLRELPVAAHAAVCGGGAIQ
ncbi:hypothetical protein JKP88DRAFT_255652 [Tribonema minus]|uniref:Tyr recombinase domain-containing protein n=1 Tax=Tribonema minus TaxID=303371 RepID=A0A836CHG6_9STRA|nr:hypothetical protein JKP88DRAFT_255652 [Tribonema minus]